MNAHPNNKDRKAKTKSHDWKKRQAEIKDHLDRIDKEIELRLSARRGISPPHHD